LKTGLRAVLLSLAILALTALFASAQSGKGPAPADDLYQTIKGLDAELFDAYNKCDLDKLGSMVADDLEFYHDQTGLSTGKQVFLTAIKNNICGKVHRELLPGTLEVYPLKGYGAVEIGEHRFTHPNEPNSNNVGDAKFVQLWQLKDGTWKITRVISFDHNSRLAK
jgi:hypothetical protein